MTDELIDYIGDSCLVITLAQGQPVNISIGESSEQARENIISENDGVVKTYSSEYMTVFSQNETGAEWIIIDNGHFIFRTLVPDGEIIISRNENYMPGLGYKYKPNNGVELRSIFELFKHLYIPMS